jgi:SET domain-containing protein
MYLRVIFTLCYQGFIVVADAVIADLTLVAEYSGEVDLLKNCIQETENANDVMDLLRSGHSSSSLIIRPKHRGNIARFISGVNNQDKKAASAKVNLKCARFDIDGQVRVVIYANKKIKKGEVLYYDYNALVPNQFNTHTFV